MGFAGYRVGKAQTLGEGGRPQSDLGRAVGAVRHAAVRGCRLVVLPECLDLGRTGPSARRLAQPVPGPYELDIAPSFTTIKEGKNAVKWTGGGIRARNRSGPRRPQASDARQTASRPST
jgi:hypothetical protein